MVNGQSSDANDKCTSKLFTCVDYRSPSSRRHPKIRNYINDYNNTIMICILITTYQLVYMPVTVTSLEIHRVSTINVL